MYQRSPFTGSGSRSIGPSKPSPKASLIVIFPFTKTMLRIQLEA
jgi:hypothetical protein